MAVRRRWLRVATRLSVLLIGLLVAVLVVSQTPWFRDWLRRTAMRQAERFVEGQLVIGRLDGRLFDGVTLTDVAIVQDGAPVVSIDRVSVTYGLGELLSDGRVIAHLDVQRPVVRAVQTPTGWNVARLLKPRAPARPDAPRATFWLPDIAVSDGLVSVAGVGVEPSATIPRSIEGLAFRGAVRSSPEALRIEVNALSLRATEPDLTLQSFSGSLVNSAEGWQFEALDVTTGASSVQVDGRLTRAEPDAPLTYALDVVSPGLSLPEIGRFIPAIAYLDLRPSLRTGITGTLNALRLDLELTSTVGNVRGPLTLDLTGPTRAVAGSLAIQGIDLAPWVGQPAATGRITGDATFDLRFPSATPGVAMDGTFAFRGPEASAYGYAATAVVAEGRLRGRRIELTARAAAYGGRATTRGYIDRPGPSSRELALSLAGRIEQVDLRQLPASVPAPELETSLAGAYTVDGPLSRLRATGVLDASTVEGASLAPGFAGSFERDGGGFRFDAQGDVEGLDLPRLGRALDVAALQHERYEGVVNGTFTVEGARQTAEPIRLAASATLRDTSVMGGRVPEMAVEAVLGGDQLDVTAKGRVDDYDLATLTGVSALTGTLSGDVDAVVSFTTLDDVGLDTVNVDGSFTLVHPTLLDVPFREVTAGVRLDGGVLDVRALQGTGDGFTLTGKGPLALGDAGSSNFTYRLDATSLVDPARVAKLPLTGAAVTEGTISGTRAAFQAAGTLTGTALAYDDTASAANVTTRYTVRVPDLAPDRLDVEATVEASGVVVAGLPLEAVAGDIGYVPGAVSFNVTARDAMRTARGTGTLVLEDAQQVLTVRELAIERDTVRWTLAPGSEAVLTLSPQAIDIAPLSLASGAQSLDVAGRVAMDETAVHALTVTASALDVGDALLLAGQDIDADGTLSLTARIGGTRAVPTAAGRLEARDGRYRDMAIALVQAQVDDDGRQAEVDAIVRQSDSAYVTAKGVVPHTLFLPPEWIPATTADGSDRLDVAIRSTSVDLRLAEGFTTQLRELTGRAQLDVRLTNTGREPVVAGDVRLVDAGFFVTATGVTYRNINGTLDFADDRLLVRQLTAESGDGRTLAVAGEVGLRNASRGNLALTLSGNGVRVVDNELGQLDIHSTLKLAGTLAAPVIEGDLVLASGRLDVGAVLARFATGSYDTERTYHGIPTYADEDAFPVVPNILREAGDPLDPTAPPPESRAAFVYEDLALNVRVRIPDNLLLRGRDLQLGRNSIGDVNVTMGGDFRVAKTAGEALVLIGAVNTVRGTYSYQGRRFDIARDGQVLFHGAGTTNPSLDITAERVIQGVEARVRIQGTAQEPTLSLSSDPPLDEADVLALIVFNQPLNQLGTGQQTSLMQSAGGVAAGFAVSPIAQALGNSLDLDVFDVETTDPSGRVNPAVVVGQQLRQDLFVKFRQQFGSQQVSQFLLEYRLADFLRLQGSFADGAGLSAGNRSLTQRIERYGADLVFYFAF